MNGSLKLGSIAGIGIRVHYTWLFIFALVTWSLATGFFPQAYPGWDPATYWITGGVAALLLFGSVLLHELAHSFVAISRGLPVHSITLFVFGGVSNIQEEPDNPRTELFMAIVGPLTSLVLAAVLFGVFQFIQAADEPVAAIIFYLAFINGILGVFNLIPGFPLDGGRVLRSIIWGVTGSLTRATNIAGTVGQIFGFGLIALGIFQIFGGAIIGGIWLAFIGWFLTSAAEASKRDITLRRQLSGIPVEELMDPSPDTVGPGTTVQALVENVIQRRHRRAAPVVDDGRLLGIVTITDVGELPQEKWANTPVSEIMTREPLHSISPDSDAYTAMKSVAQNDINQILVVKEGQLVGMITRAGIINYLQVKQELGRERRSRRQ